MDKRFVAVLMFAFIVATLASAALYRLTTNRSQFARPAPPTKKVVLASRDLELGSVIRESDLMLSDWLGDSGRTYRPGGGGLQIPQAAVHPCGRMAHQSSS
jgi:Flp pilus assembly protein CpaB